MLCGLISHGLGGFFVGLIDILHQEHSRSPDMVIVSHLKSATSDSLLWPNDRILIDRLEGTPMAGAIPRRRMVLEALELDLRSDKTEQLLKTDGLTIEHIMPQKWETHWPLHSHKPEQDELDRRDQLIKYLGNLTLTTSKLNSSLSNAPWNEKRQTLCNHSVLLLNRSLLEKNLVWGDQAILERTSELAHRVARLWRPAEDFEETQIQAMGT